MKRTTKKHPTPRNPLIMLCAWLAVVVLAAGCTDTLTAPNLEDGNDVSKMTIGTAQTAKTLAGPYVLIPFVATASFTSFDPGPGQSDGETWYVRDLIKSGPLTGDLEGEMVMVLNGDINLDTGSGPGWGTFRITTDEGSWSGTVEGTFSEMSLVFTGDLVSESSEGTSQSRLQGTASDAGAAPESDEFVVSGSIIQRVSAL
ncbi:hypothetical protein [Rhodocaloribacter sp.]